MNEQRKNRRKLALQLMRMSNARINPIDEIVLEPLYQIDDAENLASFLREQVSAKLEIDITPAESMLMLKIASGLSSNAIATDEIKSFNTISTHRKSLFRKIRNKYPSFEYSEVKAAGGNPRSGRYDPSATITIITLRLLNQLI